MITDFMSDVNAVNAVRAGQLDRFEYLVRTHQQSVFQVVSAILMNQTQSEQMVQRVFLTCFEYLDQYESHQPFGNWVKSIAKNEVHTFLRQMKTKEKHLMMYRKHLEHRLVSDRFYEVEAERLKKLSNGLDKLPHASKKVLELHYRKSLPIKTLAKIMEKTPATILKLLSRARDLLRTYV